MFADRDLLIDTLSKLVGIYPSINDDYAVSPNLSQSSKRRYVDQNSGLISIENIDQSKKGFSAFPYPAYSGSAIAYDKFTIVKDGSTYYDAIQAVPVSTPITDTNFWYPLTPLDLYLYGTRYGAVDTALDAVFNDKKMRERVKSIYENVALFKGVTNYRNTQENTDDFVGLRFRVKSDIDLVTIVNKIGTTFSESVSFNMYLYHSSQQEPLFTIPINHTKANSSQWHNQDGIYIRYLDELYDAGGDFYLGYAQSELGTAKALNMHDLDWFNGYAGRCPYGDCADSRELWKTYSPYIDVKAFSVPESSFTVGSTLFDPQDVNIHYGKNYGLNCNMSTECDLTPFFTQDSSLGLFAEAISYSWALDLVRNISVSTRGTNNIPNQIKEDAKRDILSFPEAKGTLLDRTNNSLKGLTFDLSGLNSECLSCKTPTITDGSHKYQIIVDNPLGV